MSCGKDYPEPADGTMNVVFDFDGTLAEPCWPQRGVVGKPIPEGIEMLKHYAEQGYVVYIQTARPEWDKGLIRKFVKDNRLPVDGISCGAKIAAGLYIDDRGHRPWYTKLMRSDANG